MSDWFLLANQTAAVWYLPPLAIAISLVYSASRYEHPPRVLRRAFKLFLQILFFMGLMLGALIFFSTGQ